MKMKTLLSSFLCLTLSCLTIDSFAFEWPVVDSEKPYHDAVIEKFIANAKNERGNFKYIGEWFRIDPNALSEHIGFIEDLYREGHHIQIKPTSSKEIYQNFQERCQYKILVDDQTLIEGFRVYKTDENQNIQLQPLPQPQQPNLQNQLPRVSEDLVSGWYNRRLGRGAPRDDLSAATISNLLDYYKDHTILKHAFHYMMAADLSDIQDPILFADFIKKHGQISQNTVVNAMNRDIGLLKQAKNSDYGVREGHKERGLDYGNQLSYPLKTMTKAINLIREYPSLLQGKLHDDLKSLKGGEAIVLLHAQYYIASLQSKASNSIGDFKALLKKIGGLYHHELPSPQILKNILGQTELVVGDMFYTPAHNYVKHGDVTKTIKQEIENLPNGLTVSGKLTQIYTDCSGFSIMILRKLFPDYNWIQNNRAMSWQFAGAYDLLTGGDNPTHYIKNGVKQRLLSDAERSHLYDYGNYEVAQKLTKMLTAVTYDANRKAGDILVQRPKGWEGEGHVMTIVDPHPTANPDEVIIAEMTQYGFDGPRNGLIWRKLNLKNCGVTRILRPRLS